MFKNILLVISVTFICINTTIAQSNIAVDKVVATVGEKSVFLSDINNFYTEMKIKNDTIDDTYKCEVLYNFISQKVLSTQAFRDSLIATDEQIEAELEDRINYFLQQYGSKEAMESRLGKSVYQIKEENRTTIKEQLETKMIQGNVSRNVVITPEEVKSFYNDIEKDKLPFINAAVEIGQIIINPKASDEIEQYTKSRLEEIRAEIINKTKEFKVAAGIYSEDPGTRDEGGLMTANKSELDPNFASAAFRLKNGEISPVIRSAYGYHIIKMIKKSSNSAQIRHILLVPQVTSKDVAQIQETLDSAKKELQQQNISYNEALKTFSNDDLAKSRGGMMYDFSTGSTTLTLDKLDPQTAAIIEKMKVGDYSDVHIFSNPYKRGAKGIRILFLKKRIDPHVANLQEDFTMFQSLAKMEKTQKEMEDYTNEVAKTIYIKVAPEYQSCPKIKALIK